MRTEDGHIIRKCLDGESEAFGFLIDKYKESVYAFAYAKLRNFHDAEDVTQEVFIKAYRKLRTLRRWDSFLAWLYHITSNLCKMWIRTESRRPDSEFIEDKDKEILEIRSMDFHHDVLRHESLHDQLQEALDLLPELYRQALILHYLGGMSCQEIARFLGTSPTAIWQRLSRARAQLRKEMLPMMASEFKRQKLPAGFTFSIVQAVERIKVQPAPRTTGLPWGLSLAAGIIIGILSLGSYLPLSNFIDASAYLPASGRTAMAELGEVPVDMMKISQMPAMTGTQGSGYGAKPTSSPQPDGLLLAPSKDETVFHEEPIARLGKGRIRGLAYTPDGEIFIAATDIGIRLYNAGELTEIGFLEGQGRGIICASLSPDGRLLATGNSDNTIQLWDIEKKDEIAIFRGHSSGVYSVAFSTDSAMLASGSLDNTVRLWDVVAGKELAVFRGHTRLVVSVAFGPDGKLVASGGDWDDSTVRLWDVEERKEVAILRGHTGGVLCVDFSPDGKLLASGGGWQDYSVRIWDVDSREEIVVLKEHSNYVRSVSFSPDGELLASGSSDGTIRLWDVAEKREVAVLEGHSVWPISFSPDGKIIASGSHDGIIRFWNVEKRSEVDALSGFNSLVYSVSFSSDGNLLAVGEAWNNTVRLWDIARREEVAVLEQPEEAFYISVSFSPDGKLLASGNSDDSIVIWNMVEQKRIAVLEGHDDAVNSVAFNSDGEMLASGSRDKTVQLWNMERKNEVDVLKDHIESVNSVLFSPDGRLLASGSDDKTIRIWNMEGVKQAKTLRGHTSGVTSLSFSPDGELLASGSYDKTVRLWNVERKDVIAVLRGHAGGVYSVSFSPNGKFIASAGDYQDNAVRLWDVAERKEVAVLRGHAGTVRSVSFSPDGKLLASASLDGTVLIWEVNLEVQSKSIEPDEKQLVTWGKVKNTKLYQNYPNPFNPETWIPFSISKPNHVKISIHNSNGQLVRKLDLGQKISGAHLSKERAAYWDGKNSDGEEVASGIYFYVMEAGDYIATRKMVLTR